MSELPLLVIGAGPAGIAAAVEALRVGSSVLLLDSTGTAGGLIAVAHEVRNVPFLHDRVSGEQVAEHLIHHARKWGAEVLQADIDHLESDGHSVVAHGRDGRTFVGAGAVVATGTVAIHPSVEGLPTDFGPPWACTAPEAWQRARPSRAAVIGGSDVAFDQARWLRARGVSVDLLCRAEQPRAPKWLIASAIDEGVVVNPSTRIELGQMADGGALLRTSSCGDVRERAYDVVVAAVGRVPKLPDGFETHALGRQVRLAGDVVGRRARHVIAALGDGCVAAEELLSVVMRRSRSCRS